MASTFVAATTKTCWAASSTASAGTPSRRSERQMNWKFSVAIAVRRAARAAAPAASGGRAALPTSLPVAPSMSPDNGGRTPNDHGN